jgi:hypothetical protein
VLLSLIRDPSQLHRPGAFRALSERDFTQLEHQYYFKVLKSLPEGAVQDSWVLKHQVQKLARYEGAPDLNIQDIGLIDSAARTLPPEPAEQLIFMTVRRTVANGSTAMEAAAGDNRVDPRRLVAYALGQTQQATQEAWRYHQQSVPEQPRYTADQARIG